MNWEKVFFDFDKEYSKYCKYIASREWSQVEMLHGYLIVYIKAMTIIYDSQEKIDENIFAEISKRKDCIYGQLKNGNALESYVEQT